MNLFEHNRNQEMKNSLYLEFHYSIKPSLDSILIESKGNMNNIDDYIIPIMTKFRRVTNNGNMNAEINITTTDFKSVKNKIADDFNIVIEYDKDKPFNLKGVYNDKLSKLEDNVLDNITIKIKACGDYYKVIRNLPSMIAHEFLHAYEKLMRLRKNGKEMQTEPYTNNNITRTTAQITGNQVMEHISMIYYFCTSFERNAYIAQLNNQIKQFKDDVQDSDTAFQILQNLPLYKQYITFGNTLNFISKNKDRFKDDIEEWYENVYEGKHLSYGKIIRRLINLYNKTWRKIRKTTASYIRQLYETNLSYIDVNSIDENHYQDLNDMNLK